MYEVNERAFSVSGNFQGVMDRLDSIKALGVNVIWLMPIHPIGKINSVNSPYSVKNYYEVNPEFGTLTDLRKLVDEAHNKNIAVILDWVANHTAWDNPWIDNISWYTQDGSGHIISPPGTNWQDVADLNYSNQNMRLAMIKAMKFWILTANIDGFRCDAADLVPFDFWQQAINSLKNIPNRNLIFLAEGSRTDHFTAGFQMNYSWDFYNSLKNIFKYNDIASDLFTVDANEYSLVPAGKKKLRFTTNHDESAWDATPMTLFNGKQGALAASIVTSYLNGVPLIYGSQEVGTVNKVPFFTKVPINWTLNSDMLNKYKSIFSFYNSSNALRKGELETFPNNSVVSFKRKFQTEEVFVIVNLRNNNTNYTIPSSLQGSTWINAFDNSSITLPASITLSPYQYKILKN
jgi:glycosidase